MSLAYQFIDMEQGSQEWLALRKTKITATDASIIMGASHWKTKVQLYHEKTSDENIVITNERMQRGTELEPEARDAFMFEMGVIVAPKVVVKDWAMASLDGLSDDGACLVEIKCPGQKDHAIAVSGKIPAHYFPQLQHQMYVCDLNEMYYYSYDGSEGIAVLVCRDDKYIAKMIEAEFEFYNNLVNKIPPEPDELDYIEREDSLWQQCASKWISVNDSLKRLEQEEEDLRKQLIFLSGECNTRGAGISLSQFQRKGNVEYSKIPELNGVNLEPYRKTPINSWRITCN